MLDLLKLASKYAVFRTNDGRTFFIGAVGVRNDGRIVHSHNDAVLDTCRRGDESLNAVRSKFVIYKRFPESHAESRLTKKIGFGGIVYVARVARGSGELAMSRPCECCQNILKFFRVKKVYYTINNTQWGVWDPIKNTDYVFNR